MEYIPITINKKSEIIKLLSAFSDNDLSFTPDPSKDWNGRIGYIKHWGKSYEVLFMADNFGRYIGITDKCTNVTNLNAAQKELQERIVSGRFAVEGPDLRLTSIFAMVDTDLSFVGKQLMQSINVVWDMKCIAEHLSDIERPKDDR